MDLYGLKYNNYYNRIIKKEDNAVDYFAHSELKATQFNVNFNPNDGITTTQIVNDGKNQHWEECDYVLLTDNQTSTVNVKLTNLTETTVASEDKEKLVALLVKHTAYGESLCQTIVNMVDSSPFTTQFSCKSLPDAAQLLNEISNDADLRADYSCEIVSGTVPVISRWFSLKATRTRGNQYELQLKRDAIADNYEAVLNADCYINKATITDVSNPLLYNKEDLAVNQIKTNETLLKDNYDAYYYVAYMAKDNKYIIGNDTVSATDEEGITTTYIKGNSGSAGNISLIIPQLNINYAENYTPNYYIKPETPLGTVCPTSAAPSTTIIGWRVRVISTGGSYSTKVLNLMYHWDTKRINYVDGISTGLIPGAYQPIGVDPGIYHDFNWAVIKQYFIAEIQANTSNFEAALETMISANTDIKRSYTTSTLASIAEFRSQLAMSNLDYHDTWSYNGVATDHYWHYDPVVTVYSGSRSIAGHSDDTNTMTDVLAGYFLAALNKAYSGSAAVSTAVSHPVSSVAYGVMHATCTRFLQDDTVSSTILINSTRSHTNDAQYDLLVIPSSITFKYSGTNYTIGESNQVRLATELAKKGISEGWLYDIQKVPYSELSDDKIVKRSSDGTVDYSAFNQSRKIFQQQGGSEATLGQAKFFIYLAQSKNTSLQLNKSISINRDIKEIFETEEDKLVAKYTATTWGAGETKTIGLHDDVLKNRKCNSLELCQPSGLLFLSNYQFALNEDGTCNGDFQVTITNLSLEDPVSWIEAYKIKVVKSETIVYTNDLTTDTKISNQCDMYRLCSPGQRGIFEFSLAKNGGTALFNVDCTFRPINPYVHVSPVFSNLYGTWQNDYRGLICEDKFSIDVIKDKWLDYAAQNKYLGAQFNREIKSLNVSQDIQRQEAFIGAVSGTVQGAAQGAKTGFSLGGGWGAVAGAAVGGATGAVGGVMDYNNLIIQQQDSLALKKDSFNYALQNIQAQPNALVNTASDDANYKIWPYIEYYTCTDKEKEAFKSKLQYEGMTVNIIDKISNYKQDTEQFIRAKLIRSTDIDADAAVVSDIASELSRGVYL